MDNKSNIVLIGMPASGKSTIGVILAKMLGKDFLDTDLVIQQREQALLCEIIEQRGGNSNGNNLINIWRN